MHGRPDATMHIRVCVVGLGFDLRVPRLLAQVAILWFVSGSFRTKPSGLGFRMLGMRRR